MKNIYVEPIKPKAGATYTVLQMQHYLNQVCYGGFQILVDNLKKMELDLIVTRDGGFIFRAVGGINGN